MTIQNLFILLWKLVLILKSDTYHKQLQNSWSSLRSAANGYENYYRNPLMTMVFCTDPEAGQP